MLTHNNDSDTVIIVLHEIYGINEHIVNVCEKLSKYKYDVIAPNLLNGRGPFSYDQEMVAYNYFMNSIGIESAFNQVKEVLHNVRANYKKVYVLGYSVGATLAWLCSETGLCNFNIGFYGSRIRDYLEIEPKCPVLLLFPTEEIAFDVDDLTVKLNCLDNTKVIKIYGKHGFANQFSKNYNNKSALIASKAILLFLKKVLA